MRDEYDLINRNLVEVLGDNNNVYENLAEVERWIAIKNGELPQDDSLSQLPKIEALVQFASLTKLLEQTQPLCDLVGLDIIKRNEEACGTDISMPGDEIGPLRKVEEIVHQVGLLHARLCRYNYPASLVKLLETTKIETLRELKKMLNAIIMTSKNRVFTHNTKRVLDDTYILREKSRGVTIHNHDEVQALLKYLIEASRQNPKSSYLSVFGDPLSRKKWTVNEMEVRQLMDRYVFNRCYYLERSFGQVLEPATFDQQFYDRDNQYRAVDYGNGQIMIYLQYYRLCKIILGDRDKLTKLVINQIWNGNQ